MSTDIPASEYDGVEVVGVSDGVSDAALWGAVPVDQRLEWLRAAERHWPFYPGAAVAGLTARALSEGKLVHSEALIRVARNAFEAGFTPDEYAQFRALICGRIPANIVITRPGRNAQPDGFFEIDAHRCRGWLDRVRAGQAPGVAADLFVAEQIALPAAPQNRETDGGDAPVEFGSGRSSGSGWGIPFGGHGSKRGWWRVFEVYPPRRGVNRRGTGKYASDAEGKAWEQALETIANGLSAVGFTPEHLYMLSLTLERLDEDQWARVDKRLFFGEGVHTRAGWRLSPIPVKWAEWPRLAHAGGKLPHEATETVLGGVWRPRVH